MQKRTFVVSAKSLTLFICLLLFVLRDMVRVLLGHYTYGIGGWTFERFSGPVVMGIIIISILFLIFYVLQFLPKKRFPGRLRIAFYLISILTLFWTIHSLFTVPGYSISTLDGTAKTIWICMLGLWIGYDDDSWEKIRRWIPLLSLLYLTVSSYYVFFVRFGTIAGDTTNQRPYWMLYSTGFWLFAYALLCQGEENDRNSLFILISMFLNLLIVSFTISRGWLFLTGILYVLFFLQNKSMSKKRKRTLIFLFVLMVGVGLYLLRDQVIASISDYIFKFTVSRSRETQFGAFFSQVPITKLITGAGEHASYSYKGNPNYIYIDNSYLYYAFHFGFLFAFIMIVLVLRESVRAIRVRKQFKDGNIGFILFMWFLALSGVSVYCAGYEVSFRVLFIMMLIGRAAKISEHDYSIDN